MKKVVALAVIFSIVGLTMALAGEPEKATAPKAFDKEQAVGTKATDPVSGKEFTITDPKLSSQYEGKWYYFENKDNKAEFDKDPAKYAVK